MAFGVIGSPPTLDPFAPTASNLTYALDRPVYPSLFRLTPRGAPRAYLASSLSRDGDRVIVRLHRARWSNGRPITARDVAASAARARPPSGWARFDTVRPLGERTVEIRGVAGSPARALATAAFVLPRGEAKLPGVSGGPFSVRSYRPGLDIVYVRDPKWFGRNPARLRQVTVEFVASSEQLLQLVMQNRLDAAAPPSGIDLGRAFAPAARVKGALGWELIYLDLNRSRLSAGQRRAVIAAVQRRKLGEGLVGDEGRVATTLTPGPRGGPGPGAARASRAPLEPPPRPLQVSLPSGDELLELIGRALYAELRHRGIEADVVSIDPATFYGAWKLSSPTDVSLRRWVGAPRRAPPGVAGKLSAYPLFRVPSFVAWRASEVSDLRPNPTLDGPLWNMQEWWRPAAEGRG